MHSENIQSYLNRNSIPYEIIEHPRAITAEEISRSAQIPSSQLAKTVVLRVNGELTLVVLHADERIDLDRLSEYMEVSDIELCPEDEFMDYFPDCELGAMPPFGDLYGMSVIVSESVASDDIIVFNAGTHTELIKMRYADFARVLRPMVGCFACH